MVRVQACEAGTIGGARSTFRLVGAGTIFDLSGSSELPGWVVAVPEGTKLTDAPLAVKRDQKTKKWVIVTEPVAAPAEAPRTFSEIANAAAKVDAKVLKNKSVVDALS